MGISPRFPTLTDFSRSRGLVCSRGVELRPGTASEAIEPVAEVTGKQLPVFTRLPRREVVFEFPPEAVEVVPESQSFVRQGRASLPLSVCRPPHIIIHESGRFAVYTDEFMVVPPGQFGIAGSEADAEILKAVSLYLISDYSIYHQFLASPQWGISTSVSTLQTLKSLPIPFADLKSADLAYWANLHSRIVAAARRSHDGQGVLFGDEGVSASDTLGDLLNELNSAVLDLLQLTEDDRILVSDLVHVRMQLVKGKVTADVSRRASEQEFLDYGAVLLDELDAFIADQPEHKHSVTVLGNGQSAIVGITLFDSGSRHKRVRIAKGDSAIAASLTDIQERVQKKNSQWMYFRRNLRLYEGRNTYIFKPLERLHWTKSQAILDAGSIIAETLS